MTQKFLPEDRHEKAPRLPVDRPPTKRETWEHFHALYFDLKGHKKTSYCDARCDNAYDGELESFCRNAWVWYYVSAYNFREWRKQPDWKEGDPVVSEGVPDEPFMSGDSGKWSRTIDTLLETVNQLTERTTA